MGEESALVHELRTLGSAAEDASRFIVRHGGYAINVEYSGGSSSSLTLSARFDDVARADHEALRARPGDTGTYRDHAARKLVAIRPLGIELRRETTGDLDAKREGLNTEWQSGDSAFDDGVYVSTEGVSAELLTAVLGTGVRRGTIELLALGFRDVKIDDAGLVRAYLSEFASRTSPLENRGARAIAAFARILADLPVVTASGELHALAPLAGSTLLFRLIGSVGWGFNVAYVIALLWLLKSLLPRAREPILSGTEIVVATAVGVAAGGLGAKIYGGMMRERVQGTSRASAHVGRARLAAFGGVSVIVFTLIVVGTVLFTQT